MADREEPEELGRRLVREMRTPLDEVWSDDDCATDRLRWGGDDLDDETLWGALLGALDEAASDEEFFSLGDGFVPESIRTRLALDERLRELEQTDARMQRLIRIFESTSYSEFPWRSEI